MVEHFQRVLRSLVSRLPDGKRGLLLILDDINGLAESEEFANWLKSLVDEIAGLNVAKFRCPTLPIVAGDSAEAKFWYEGFDLLTLQKEIEREYAIAG